MAFCAAMNRIVERFARLKEQTKKGFVVYIGAGDPNLEATRQLALALLADHLRDDTKALALSEAFMRHVVAYLDNAWCLTSVDVDEALAEMG